MRVDEERKYLKYSFATTMKPHIYIYMVVGPGGVRRANLVMILGIEVTFNPFRAPEPLPILNPSNSVSKNGFPVVKGLREAKNIKKKCEDVQ